MFKSIKVFINKIFSLLLSPHPEGTRYTIALASLLWGLMLLVPTRPYHLDLMQGMESLLSINIWGGLFLAHGILGLYCAITSRRDNIAFSMDIIFGMFLWTTSTVALLMSSVVPPAYLSAQIILTLCTLWLFIRFNLQKE